VAATHPARRARGLRLRPRPRPHRVGRPAMAPTRRVRFAPAHARALLPAQSHHDVHSRTPKAL